MVQDGRGMRKMLESIFMCMLLIVMVLPVNNSVIAGDGNVIYVDDDNVDGPWDGTMEHPYQHIQDAIDNASEGDTILVRDGTYIENINVYKDHLTIKSEDGPNLTIVQAARKSDHVFEVTANYVNISGFTAKGTSNHYPNYPAGIYLNSVHHCTISNNNVLNNHKGIYLSSSNSNKILNNIANSNSNRGIYLYSSSDNILTNNIANNNWHGIELWYSSNNNILMNNTADGNNFGILVEDSSNNVLINNTANSNSYGIYLRYSSKDNTLKNNKMSNNTYNFNVYGWKIPNYYHDIDTSNLVDGRPIYYWVDCRDAVISDLEDPGFVALVSCDNITVRNLNLHHNYYGILLVNTVNSNLFDNTANNNWIGIYLWYSSNNVLAGNTANNNKKIAWEGYGIHLYHSSNNILTNNTVNNNEGSGIELWYSSNNNILANNTVNDDWSGIRLLESSNNIMKSNNIVNNDRGICIDYSNNNKISYNNFIDNDVHTRFITSFGSFNRWNRNYWDNWIGVGPKIIYGSRVIEIYINEYFIPWLKFDWHPARAPYFYSKYS